MRLIADLHSHTLVSNHAFNTLTEMILQAKKLGFVALAITDHGPSMPDSPHPWYFYNFLTLPDVMEDIVVLKGVEANVLDEKGTLDIPQGAGEFDWVIASMHGDCFAHHTQEACTQAWLAVAENPLVDMIGHCEQRQYPFDVDVVTKAFAKNKKVVEVNANSPIVRPGNEENLRNLILACKRNNVKISVNSDAHNIYHLGKFETVTPLLEELEFPIENIINSSVPRLREELKLHNKKIYKNLGE